MSTGPPGSDWGSELWEYGERQREEEESEGGRWVSGKLDGNRYVNIWARGRIQGQ